ncbi:DUF2471 family protein [Burkholderia multivorans]|nr:DUF2471 family protein [Burkholderia multivorans]MDN7866044.1 DUF2471 family protein [Burkholderia multivorans]MDN8054079.1 DUF2471 family protein [Burkholderia multivorans]
MLSPLVVVCDMNLAPTSGRPDSDVDPVWYAHALALATEDLRRVATLLTKRYISAGLAHAISWPLLLEIEEQAFSDLAFQSRNDPAIVAALPRIGPATMPGVDFSGLIDWNHTEPSLPIVYQCVRALLVGVSISGNGRNSV